MRTLPLTEAKAHLSELVEAVHEFSEVVTITRHGVPAAVLLSAAEFESLVETQAWLAEPGIEQDLAEARSEILAGQTVELAQLTRQRRDRTA